MTIIRDRRNEPFDDKYGTDKLRYIRRYKDVVREAIHKKVASDSLKDLGKGGIRIPLPKSTTREPIFHHAQGENFHRVFPGNVRFDVGDRIPKPPPGQGGRGTKGSNDPDSGEDDFIWLNEEEFKDIFFNGRRLPNMTKMTAAHIARVERKPSGYTNKGPAHRMDMGRTDRKRRSDEIVLSKMAERRLLENLTEQFNLLAKQSGRADELDLVSLDKEARAVAIAGAVAYAATSVDVGVDIDNASETQNADVEAMSAAVDALKSKYIRDLNAEALERIEVLENRLTEQFKMRSKADGFREKHLTYEYDEDVPTPSAKAVVFCQMDVSGSMGQEEKNSAKAFFWLLKEFLDAAYEQVDVVYISHTTVAKEVDEKTFFYSTENGGTMVSSCLEKTQEIIAERYPPTEWNIYSAQASDGDNWGDDNDNVQMKMEELLPVLQGHYYIEVLSEWRAEYTGGEISELGEIYEMLAEQHPGHVHVAGGIRTPAEALEAFSHFFPVDGIAKNVTFMPSMQPR